jgi:DNA-binding NarL/FixJ family response regulator
MRPFVVDPHSIFRRGLAASLAMMEGVELVAQAPNPRAAWDHPDLHSCTLVVLDCEADGGLGFIAPVREATGAPVLVCTSASNEETVFAALQAGASGYLSKEALTHETLQAALIAVSSGTSVIGDGLLASVVSAASDDADRSLAQLSDREHGVLTLIADGLQTREVAQHLSYSERTVKNVLHDVVTKLGARSRSQAVAQAVRCGLI